MSWKALTKNDLQQTFNINSKPLLKSLMYSKITVQDMEDLMTKVEKFYEEHHCDLNGFRLSALILKRLKSDRDFFLSIEGVKGTGKSNFMLLLMLIMSRYAGVWQHKKTKQYVKVLPRITPLPKEWKHISISFNFDKNLSFLDSSEELQIKFNSIDRFMPFGIDEGSKNLHKQNWQNKVQFKLVQMSDTERWQNKSFLICFPNFNELNTNFRNDRIQMRIYLYVRYTEKDYASAIISVKDPSRWTSDPWHMQENERLFEQILKRTPAAFRTPYHILKAERQLKGYAGELDIPSLKTLSPKIWEIYYKYKLDNAKKETAIDPTKEKEHKNTQKLKYAIKKMMAFIKLKHPQIKYTEFSKLTNMSSASLTKIYQEKIPIEDEYATMAEAKKQMGKNIK